MAGAHEVSSMRSLNFCSRAKERSVATQKSAFRISVVAILTLTFMSLGTTTYAANVLVHVILFPHERMVTWGHIIVYGYRYKHQKTLPVRDLCICRDVWSWCWLVELHGAITSRPAVCYRWEVLRLILWNPSNRFALLLKNIFVWDEWFQFFW